MIRSASIVLSGAIFGVGLALSGMTNPARVLGFLDVVGRWDPTLLFVMAGAVAVFALGAFLLRRRDSTLPAAAADPINVRLLVGSAIFGIGWGVAGFCPGPALANHAALRLEALVFVPAMALGVLLAQRLFGADS